MFTSISVTNVRTPQAVVFAHFGEGGKGLALDPKSRAAAAGLGVADEIASAIKRADATGDSGVVVETFPSENGARKGARGSGGEGPERVLLVGLGDKAKFDVATLRAALGNVGRKLAAAKVTSVALEIEGALASAKADLAAAGSAAGEGLGLIGWVCDQFRGKGTPDPKRARLQVRAGEAEFTAGLKRGLALAESANFCRTLSQTPPNIATTSYMADQAKKLARQTGLKIKIFEGDELKRERFQGLINVGKASENKPLMIRLEYRPAGGGRGKPALLVGKTMTYDTGGLSLKINNGMVGMKRDKDGGCAVLGAMHAIATVIKPRRPVVALLAVAENSISDEAYRPDDVITYRNGVTVEVTNTDAEGRLVLADALCWACDEENPAYIVDLATLTGGVVVALGSTYCGMFCEDDGLRAKIEGASKASGERVWRLPMHAEYRELMKSPVADLVNSNPNRKAHPIQGAAFLASFVKENVPWCHLDIAGVHAAEGNKGCFIDGPTGWGTRLLAEMLDAE
jgi:leucyl aminopeptidase